LQFWFKKRLGELAHFKTRLQFRRAHQPVKNDLHISFQPKEYDMGCKELICHQRAYQHSDWFLSLQGMVTLRRESPKGP
jgi:hypothetical protein